MRARLFILISLMAMAAMGFGLATVTAQEPAPSPEATIRAFYRWYMDYIGTGEDFRNPLVDRAYHDSPLLTGDFIDRVDALLDSFEGGGYDPFLQAQDFPGALHVGQVSYAEDGLSAVARVYSTFPNQVLLVTVVKAGDGWLIDDIGRGEQQSPEDVVNSFYTAQIGHIEFYDRYPPTEPPLIYEPLPYEYSPLLTADFIRRLDEFYAARELGSGSPIVCAQDVPDSFTVEEARFAEDGESAEVVVRTSFEAHAMTVDLVQSEGRWLIDNITCGEARTPEGVVRSFYTWYLGYNQWDGQGERPNALVDGAYRDNDLLTPAFIDQVDDLLASFERGGYDPFLCAQDIPYFVMVRGAAEVTGETASLMVETSFEAHGFQVELAQDNGQWRIDNIVCQMDEAGG
jgi:hypothetical protein